MKRIRNILSKKQYIIFSISLIIVLLSTFSYAFYYNMDNTEEQLVRTDCFKLTFEDQNDINLQATYPLTEQEGSSLRPYEFTITNVCNAMEDYQVNIETLNDSDLSIDYLRYKLDNNSSLILGNQDEVTLYVNNNVKNSRKITTGTLNYNESITYNLRLWIDEDSSVEDVSDKIYKSKVVVISTPKQSIELITNGGTIITNPITREIGKTIGELESPTRVGYNFSGWYKDEELRSNITTDTIVTSRMTMIYAKWSPRTDTMYTVEHYQMDTSGNYSSTPYETENLFGTSDTIVTPPVKTYTGFTSPETQNVNINADGSRIVKYYYSRNKYTQTTEGRYMNTSGTYGSYSTLETKDVYYGVNYSYSVAQTTEYKASSPSISYTVTGTQTNQVSFERRKYTQKVQARYMDTSGNYGSYSDVSGKTIDYYYGATVPAYSVAATTEYAAASVASYTVTGAATKQMSFARNKYTITYNANSGSVSPTSVSVYYNATTKLPTPTRSGYIFAGWYTAKSGGTKYGNAGASYKVTAAKTMYAHWTTPTLSIDLWQKPDTKNESTTTVTIGSNTYSSVGGATSSSLNNYWYSKSYSISVVGGTSVTITSNYGSSTRWYTSNSESAYLCTGSKLTGKTPSSNSSIFVYPDVGGHNNAKRRVVSSLTNLKCS